MIHIWRVPAFGRPSRIPTAGRVTALAFSPDARFLAAGGAHGTGWIWDLPKRTRPRVLRPGHTDAITSIAFSPNGRRLVTGSRDTDARVWNATTGKQIGRALRRHGGTVSDAQFSPDGRLIVTAGPVTAGLWHVSGNELLLLTRVQPPVVRAAVFAPRGERIFTGSDGGTIRSYTCDVCGGTQALLHLAKARPKN